MRRGRIGSRGVSTSTRCSATSLSGAGRVSSGRGERVCSRVAVIVAGSLVAEGTIDEVRGEVSLEERFVELVGGAGELEGLEWLHTFSD